ncbi:hypothetical protein HAX54_048174 [Datura stramonium]|uniref:Wall-associated receptor kinase galacturonan-binding domain-containing protein n=1 Tax=Datura stramonium TaxID=4076 RepID=A0ABS8STY4_DATST|nr:hypothetical protein [Datura stramonium]
MYGGTKFLTILIFLQLSEMAFAEQCVPSSCGHIRTISFPFRLKSDPKHCGLEKYELSCEGNHTIFYGHNESYYYVVQAINYENSTIRVVDPDIREELLCSLPQHSRSTLSPPPFYGFTTSIYKPGGGYTWISLAKTITIFSCPFAINFPAFAEITNCINRSTYASNASSDLFKGHTYATMDELFTSHVRVGCTVDLQSTTSWHTEDAHANISILSFHNALAYGFELSWFRDVYCDGCPHTCEGENSRDVRCVEHSCTYYHFGFNIFSCVAESLTFDVLSSVVPWMLCIAGEVQALQTPLRPSESLHPSLLEFNTSSSISSSESVKLLQSGSDSAKIDGKVIDPALKGTLNVLGSVAMTASIRRVVLTSSVVAVAFNGKLRTPEVVVDETWWSDPDFCRESQWSLMDSSMVAFSSSGMYFRRLWLRMLRGSLSKRQSFDMVTINPAMVIGALLQPTLNTSCAAILQLLNGMLYLKATGAETYPNATLGWVSVKDVSLVHILAFENSSANGRYLMVESVAHYSELESI